MSRVTRLEVVTIASGGTTSNSFEPKGAVFANLGFPAALTGTTIKPQVRLAVGGSWLDVDDGEGSGDAVLMTFYASKAQRIPDRCFPCAEMRFVSSGTEAAARTFTIVTGD